MIGNGVSVLVTTVINHFNYTLISVKAKLKKYMKFDQEKFFEKNIDSDIDSKKKEIDNSINKQYDVR